MISHLEPAIHVPAIHSIVIKYVLHVFVCYCIYIIRRSVTDLYICIVKTQFTLLIL